MKKGVDGCAKAEGQEGLGFSREIVVASEEYKHLEK